MKRNIKDYSKLPTLTHRDCRNYQYREEEVREQLRSQIIRELMDLTRLKDDDSICLGCGGARPNADVKCEKKAFYVIGPLAAGKSGIANRIADYYGAYI